MMSAGPSRLDLDSMEPAELNLLIEQRLAERTANVRASMFGALKESGWLALVPFATVPIAKAAGVGNIEATLELMKQRGLVEVSRSPAAGEDAPEDAVYSMTTAGRSAFIEHYAQQSGGARRLRAEVARFARSFSDSTALSPPMRRWMELARYADDGHAFAEGIERHIDAAFRKRDAAELLNWIEAARSLVELASRDLDNSGSLALERAGRRLELLNRRAQDERHLRAFMPRDEQVQALRSLVRESDTLWALHLFGVGGVGKTMLLRYLTGYLAPEEFKAPTARIDFDYLNPDYPRLDPGLLLWSFAQELRAYDKNGSASEMFDAADALLQRLYQELSTQRSNLSVRPTEHPLFVDAVAAFIDALRRLPQPVIFIVDTCEELAKMRPDGSVPENVEETFRILCGLHDGPLTLRGEPATGGLPSLRVVFAGRRPLASAGHGWTCASSSQPPRPYLRLQELRGFTHEEARRFLTKTMRIPPALVEPVMARSPDVGSPSTISWADGTRNAEVPRCNPYDLRLYADWAREDPPPAPETIRASSPAQYVELRILRRLESFKSLRRILPLVTCLKYFDDLLVRAVLEDEVEAAAVYERLRQQEWVDERRVTDPDGTARTILSMEEGLRRRLRAYFVERGELDADMHARACDHLEHLTLQKSELRQLDWASFDATLRALESEPDRAARWWNSVEDLIVAERGYDWLLQIAASLLAEPNAAAAREPQAPTDAPPESPIRPAIMAAFLSAMLHQGKPPAGEIAWNHVLRALPNYPGERGRTLLEWRANAGLTVAAAAARLASREQVVEAAAWMDAFAPLPALSGREQAQAAAASAAAHEAFLDWMEGSESAGLEAWKIALPSLSSGPVALARTLVGQAHAWRIEDSANADAIARLVAFSSVQAARASALAGDYTAAHEWFLRALDGLGQNDAASATTVWRDWRPPENLWARARLECARLLYPAFLSAAETLETIGPVPYPAPDNDDSDRLASLYLQLRDATGIAEPRDTGPLANREPRCYAHRAVAPGFVTGAMQHAARGEFSKALGLLRQTDNLASTLPLELLRHADRAIAQVILRLRLMDQGARGPTTLAGSPIPGDRALIWTISGHAGEAAAVPEKPEEVTEPHARAEWLHAIWQSRVVTNSEQAGKAMNWAEEAGLAGAAGNLSQAPDFIEASIRLDLAERASLASLFSKSPSTGALPAQVDAPGFWQREPHRPAEALTLALRASVLLRHPFDLERGSSWQSLWPDTVSESDTACERTIGETAERLGTRRAADIAFDVAERLMLRLPARAAPLFERAARWYDSADDRVGAFLAALRATIAASMIPVAFWKARTQTLERYRRLPESLAPANDADNDEALRAELKAMLQQPDRLRQWLGDHQGMREWLPTLSRLLACLEPDPLPPIQQGSAARSLDFQIVSRRPGLAGTAAPMAAGAPAAAEPPPPKAAKNAVEMAVGFVVLGIFGVLLYGGFKLFQTGLASTAAQSMGNAAHVGLYIAVLVLLGWGVPAAVLAARAAWASLTHAHVAIAPAAAVQGYRSRIIEEDVNISLGTMHPRLSLMPPSVRFHERPLIKGVATTAALSDYAAAAGRLPSDIASALRSIAKPARQRGIQVTIEARPELQGPCWEGMLQLALEIERGKRWPLKCKRDIAATRSARPHEPGRFERVVVTLAAEESLHDLARRAWSALNPWYLPGTRWRVVYSSLVGESLYGDRSAEALAGGTEACGILHLLGRVQEDVAGMGFTGGSQRSRPTRESPSVSHVLRADAIVKRFPRMALAIVQPEPLQERSSRRLPGDRDDAARVRTFAADLCALGVPLVLALPRVDAPLAALVLGRLAHRLQYATRPTQGTLLDFSSDVQRIIAERAGTPEVGLESALDVTVFCSVSAGQSAPAEDYSL